MKLRPTASARSTTADDPTKYRTDADLEGPLRRDPMIRLEKHLREQGYADDASSKRLQNLHSRSRTACVRQC